MYKVPSSTPPSTPQPKRQGAGKGSLSDPSTTPAGPPPTSFTDLSFTPEGPPPSSLLVSSQLHSDDAFASSKPAFAPSSHLSSSTIDPPFHSNFFAGPSRTKNGTPARPSGLRNGYQVPSSSPPRGYGGLDDEDMPEGEEVDDERGGYEDEDEMMEVDQERRDSPDNAAHHGIYGKRQAPGTPRGTKRSRFGDTIDSMLQSSPAKATAQAQKGSDISKIASSIAASMKTAQLQDSDGLVLETEKLMGHLHAAIHGEGSEAESDREVSVVAQQLVSLWQNVGKGLGKPSGGEELPGIIGPPENAPLFRKANFLGSLLIPLHHPPSTAPDQRATAAKSTRRSAPSPPERPQPMPEVLLIWLSKYHDPYLHEIADVKNYSQGATAHDRFWDMVYMAVLRGRLGDAIRLLSDADWTQAITALNDGQEQPGYRGKRLTNVKQVISWAIDVLQACPALTSGNWEVTGHGWTIFRRHVRQALSKLDKLAKGDARDPDEDRDEDFVAEHFGILSARSSAKPLTRATERATSQVPHTIYENLKALYGQLLGTPQEIVASSADWVEATIGLAVWWDGEDDDVSRGSLTASRRALRTPQQPRQVDVSPAEAYRRKLASSLAYVTSSSDEAELQINTTNPVEVGLACVLEDNVDGVVDLLRGWSMPVSAAGVEVALYWGWEQVQPRPSEELIEGFDESDLMVLEYGNERERPSKHDEILSLYADMLLQRDAFRDEKGRVVKEGWEMAISVLSRFRNAESGRTRINSVLDGLYLESTERVDKALAICHALGLEDEALKTAERYADTVTQTSTAYGTAILYYARAHNAKKLKDVLDLLIACSLVQSLAHPAPPALDPTLQSLLASPKKALTTLSRTNPQAAQLISTYLSGYATLRTFYDLRDADANPRAGDKKPRLKPLARKRHAAEALIALVAAACESIYGGLYDPDVNAVVQVDGLLALLGEALVFVDQDSLPLLTESQTLVLLKAVEDLATAPSLIFAQCEEFLDATLANFLDGVSAVPAEPKAEPSKGLRGSLAMLERSGFLGGRGLGVGMSGSMSMSMSASMVGGAFEMVGRGEGGEEGEGGGEGGEGWGKGGGKGNRKEKGKGKRSWDWRSGFQRGAKGSDVLAVMRVGLAREMGRLWVGEG